MTHSTNFKAYKEAKAVQDMPAFCIHGYSKRTKLNQHCTRYDFTDKSFLKIYAGRSIAYSKQIMGKNFCHYVFKNRVNAQGD